MHLSEYYLKWIQNYKKETVRKVTYEKYEMTGRWLQKLEPTIDISEFTRIYYQSLISTYSKNHAHSTVVDFHRQIRSCVLDALDDEIIRKDFTRRISLGGTSCIKKVTFLEEEDAKLFRQSLKVENQDTLNWDHFLLLLLNTGLRFSEALALTKKDFDFCKLTIHVTKSYNYKDKGLLTDRFQPTKNESSVREIALDLKMAWISRPLIDSISHSKPIWPYLYISEKGRIFNSTINNKIKVHCQSMGIPIITSHGLRHTHASILIAKGVSIQAVSKRLGHSNTMVTQSTYIHLLKSAEIKANEQITSILVNW